MPAFFLFGKYSPNSLKDVSSRRTRKAAEIIETFGGKVNSMHVMLGEYDIIINADLPGTEEAMLTSVALSRATEIGFTTYPAIPVEWFDKKVGK